MAALTGGGESLCAATASDESAAGPPPASGRPGTRGQIFLSRLAEMTADIVRASLDRQDRGPSLDAAVTGRLPALY
jgi:hypothetical protein